MKKITLSAQTVSALSMYGGIVLSCDTMKEAHIIESALYAFSNPMDAREIVRRVHPSERMEKLETLLENALEYAGIDAYVGMSENDGACYGIWALEDM